MCRGSRSAEPENDLCVQLFNVRELGTGRLEGAAGHRGYQSPTCFGGSGDGRGTKIRVSDNLATSTKIGGISHRNLNLQKKTRLLAPRGPLIGAAIRVCGIHFLLTLRKRPDGRGIGETPPGRAELCAIATLWPESVLAGSRTSSPLLSCGGCRLWRRAHVSSVDRYRQPLG
jgi:hypothetical protein